MMWRSYYEHRATTLFQASRLFHLFVIDMLLLKAMEELNNITEHAKQWHHIIGQYVVGRQGLVQDLGTKDQGISNFLKKFYNSNYI
ncbi:NADH dehydrogenase [ubiquinone] 1 alpha subcomplex subunit 6-like [Fagus crenata]